MYTTSSLVDINLAILKLGNKISERNVQYKARKIGDQRNANALQARERNKTSALIYKLKKEGLVESKKSILSITKKGIKRLQCLKSLMLYRKKYIKAEDDQLKIIIFDIPEKLRKKRDWLRLSLIALGFSILQKSVWCGKMKIPEEFIDDLKTNEVFNYIQILAVTKFGTLSTLSYK